MLSLLWTSPCCPPYLWWRLDTAAALGSRALCGALRPAQLPLRRAADFQISLEIRSLPGVPLGRLRPTRARILPFAFPPLISAYNTRIGRVPVLVPGPVRRYPARSW
jgi:hypothetical protein